MFSTVLKRANGKDHIKCDDKTANKPTEKQIREEISITNQVIDVNYD